MIKKTFLIPAILFLLLSCRKDKDDPEIDSLSVYVYGAGTQIQQNARQAVYMKNKQMSVLPSLSGASAEANDIQVSGTDVYIAGMTGEVGETTFTPIKALLWKNGQVQELQTPASKSAVAEALFVSGNDVYVAGSYEPAAENAKRIAVVWKNGELTTVGRSTVATRLEDIFVSGNDVYVVGTEYHPGRVISKYWKNGQETVLSAQEGTTYAKSIYVDGSDVYAAGYTESNGNRSLNLWKNGLRTDLISGRTVIRGESVTGDQGDVYVAGYEQVGSLYAPRVFKNGVLVPMEYVSSGHVYASSVQSFAGKTYVLGRKENVGTWPTYLIWENGQEIDFLTATASQMLLKSICVVPKDSISTN